MSQSFQEVLDRIERGEYQNGAYVRKAVANGGTIVFDELIVQTVGGCTYKTTDAKDNEAFFNLVDYRGCGCNSGFSPMENCACYESIGNWFCQK